MMTFVVRFFTVDQTIIEYNIQSTHMEGALQIGLRKYYDAEPYGKLKKLEAFPKKA